MHYTLSNGVQMPCIGIGTHQAQGEGAVAPLAQAINEGYRLIDTAAAYLTEPVVAKAVQACDVPREELFVRKRYLPPIVCTYRRNSTVPSKSVSLK